MKNKKYYFGKIMFLLTAITCSATLSGCKGEDTLTISNTSDTQTESTISIPEKPAFPASSIKRASVHDPSICVDEATGKYYVFGSHLAVAVSDDLINWSQITSDYRSQNTPKIFGKLTETFEDSFKWAGYHDADCATGYAVWAPDIYYDSDYVWQDGSLGAYLCYYSASSTWRRSCIGLAVSKNIEGPYEGIDTLIYSGITKTGAVDGNSTRNTAWSNDYLNFNELIALGSANGGIDEINEKWFKPGGNEYNTNYAPNAIDPCVFDGADGKSYLVYGSWSGGLFVLEIDRKTGLVIYPGVDGKDEVSGNFIDRYYGTHIAGGNHQSGEGCFILYDEETGYYYMYETYGGLTSNGGYNMRLFRSKNVYGPYLDAAGKNANKNSSSNYMYGIKLIGNYQFKDQRGYMSAGHNSALIENGKHYLFFHQRFNEGNEFHEVRVRQQFLNEDDWPVTAVYENHGDEISAYDISEIIGEYEFIDFGTGNIKTLQNTQTISLNEDGTVSGAMSGNWRVFNGDRGYCYLTILIDKVTYKGISFKQTNDNGQRVMTFSCIGSNNTSIWGTK